jgi:flagellar biogenesis protein FliO
MFLVSAAGPLKVSMQDVPAKASSGHVVGGLAGWMIGTVRWWKKRGMRRARRAARRQMFIVETLDLGPKQRMVLLKCAGERFLVGTGPEGIRTIVRVAAHSLPGELPVLVAGDERWG